MTEDTAALEAEVNGPPYEVTLYVLNDDQPPASTYVDNGTITINCPNPTVVWLRRRREAPRG